MKKIFKLVFLLGLILTLQNCKKDYPNDVPNWVKKKIKYCKKNNCCLNSGYFGIAEYINVENNQKIFTIEYGTSMGCSKYYDEYQNIICSNGGGCWNDSCGNIPYNKLNFSRIIWSDEKCR